MKAFLEHFIVYWLYFVLFLILVYAGYILYKNRQNILGEANSHRIIFSLLILIFIAGSILRIGFISTFVFPDEGIYTMQGEWAAQYGFFNYVHEDSPAFPILISVFVRLFSLFDISFTSGLSFTSGHASAIFGSLSILLLFILVQLLFKNYNISLLSAFLLSINPLNLEYSVKGWPAVTSAFFCMLALIFLIECIKTNSYFSYVITGLCLGFIAQMYYIELVFILPILIYVFIKQKFSFSLIIRVIILLACLIISITPFVLLENISYVQRFNPNGLFSELACIWSPGRCERMEYSAQAFINHIDNHFLSYLGFMFLGIGSRDSYDASFPFDGIVYDIKNYYKVDNKPQFIYVFGSIFILLGCLFIWLYWKEWLLLFIASFVFIIGYTPFYNLHTHFLVQTFVLGIIPLVSFGLIMLFGAIKHRIVGIAFLSISVLILISPFVTENMIENLRMTKGNTLMEEWNKINQIQWSWNKSACDSLSFKRTRYECKNLMDINYIIRNDSDCATITDLYFRDYCLKRKQDFLNLRNMLKSEPTFYENLKDNIMNPRLCYNTSIFRLYCEPDTTEIRIRKINDDTLRGNCNDYYQQQRQDCLAAVNINKEYEKLSNQTLNCFIYEDVNKLCLLFKVFNNITVLPS